MTATSPLPGSADADVNAGQARREGTAARLLERARFLAEASRLLAQSLDYETTLAAVARLAMPELGSWGIVDIVEDDGSIRRLAVIHPDPAKQALARALASGYPPEVDDLLGAPRAVRERGAVLMAEVSDTMLVAAARDAQHLELLRALGVSSYMVVPMEARGRLVGSITFVSDDRGRPYDDDDLVLAGDIAARGAMAVDNARLYREAEVARHTAEQALAQVEAARRTAEDERDAATAATTAAQEAREEAVAFGVRAHASERSKSDFLSTMSHELRTPLNAVLGYADLLSAGVAGTLSAPQEALLDRQRVATRHLLALVTDVLDVARADADRLPVTRNAVGARTVLRSVLPLVRPQADARGIALHVDWRRTDPSIADARIVGDPRRVEQIIVNLVANAIKFTPPHGTVSLSVVRHTGAMPGTVDEVPPAVVDRMPSPPDPASAPSWIGLRVGDTGIGIGPDDQARVFEPFMQVESGLTRPSGGAGLGLTISRRLARLMGGDIVLESRIGEGSTFTLWLPEEPGESADAASDGQDGHAHVAMHRGGRERRGAARNATGIAAIGDAMLREVDELVIRYAERVRTDPGIPTARFAPWSEISNHTATLLADIAQALGVVEHAAGSGTELMRIGDEIRRVVAERHAQRRAQLGWSREELDRDFELLFEEVERTLRECAPLSAADSLEHALSIVRRLLETSRQIGWEAYDRDTPVAAGVDASRERE